MVEILEERASPQPRCFSRYVSDVLFLLSLGIAHAASPNFAISNIFPFPKG